MSGRKDSWRGNSALSEQMSEKQPCMKIKRKAGEEADAEKREKKGYVVFEKIKASVNNYAELHSIS